MDQPEPITNQEIPAVADRVARGLIAYLLSEASNFLGDAIGEALDDDPDAGRLDSFTRGKVYGLVWDQLGRAVAEYHHRDQVLTEAAELALNTPSGHTLCHKDAAAHVLAARTTQEH